MKKLYKIDFSEKMSFARLVTAFVIIILVLANDIEVDAQTSPAPANPSSAEWSSYVNMGANSTKDWGNGVFQLLNSSTAGCVGTAVISNNAQYNSSQTSTTWNRCYYVYFGCNDNNGDGMAFSFYKASETYGNTMDACGGGLGYKDAITSNSMITIEFDTYNSACSDNYTDCIFAGVPQSGGSVTTGANDEIAIHYNGNNQTKSDWFWLLNVGGINASVNAGNLEDDEEHLVCITYTPGANSGKLKVTIDGVTRIDYEMGPTYNLNTYFGGALLNMAWSSGQNGAFNKTAVSPAPQTIASQLALSGGVLDPACAVLPVTWLSFTGQNVGGDVVLNWATSIEKNNQKFIVERSDDKFDWLPIGEVAGAGNASTTKNYNFTDTEASAGVNYYRIRQVDYDGKYDFSSVVAVSQTAETSVSIAPNPFTDVLTIRSSETGVIGIKIHDILGKLVYQASKETSDGIIAIQPELLSGTYLITIQTETSIKQEKIIKY